MVFINNVIIHMSAYYPSSNPCKDVEVDIPVKCYVCSKNINCKCNEINDPLNNKHIVKQYDSCYWVKVNVKKYQNNYPIAWLYDDFIDKKIIHICSRNCKLKLPLDFPGRNSFVK